MLKNFPFMIIIERIYYIETCLYAKKIHVIYHNVKIHERFFWNKMKKTRINK